MSATPQEQLEARQKEILDVIALRKPDRVPIWFPLGIFAARYVGMTVQEAFDPANSEKWYAAK